MNNNKTPNMIMILDGFGLNKETQGNAIKQANTPNLDEIFKRYPNSSLTACGEAVGLPEGQMGNSEVGHMNIGAGRIVYQELLNINNQIKNGQFFENEAVVNLMDHTASSNSRIHIMGLLSDGGVHSHILHLKALIDMAKSYEIENIFVHCFLDGRDVPPRSADKYISDILDEYGKDKNVYIATIAGRYYAMDRDNRFDRIEKAFDAMVMKSGRKSPDALSALNFAYENGENDEFVVPTCIDQPQKGSDVDSAILDGDSIVMFNFRPDRAREITRALVDDKFTGFKRSKTPKLLQFLCMTEYDKTMPNVDVAYPPSHLNNTLGEYISSLGMNQLRIAETEKYAHVTFFFNGGVEAPNKNEDRILIPSPKVSTYDMKPEMSAFEVTEKVIEQIESDKYDVIILNFANADMVGHTGDMNAAIQAIEALDKCVAKIVDEILHKDGQILLTADHGNADVMSDKDGKVVTAHSLNPVPLVHISKNPKRLADGRLCDISPTLLDLMGLRQPHEMTGVSLVKSK